MPDEQLDLESMINARRESQSREGQPPSIDTASAIEAVQQAAFADLIQEAISQDAPLVPEVIGLPATQEPSAPEETAVDGEGYIYLVDGGEVIGHIRDRDAKVPFQVQDDDGANWVLELRAKTEAEILRIDALTEALISNLRALRAAQERRLAFWDFRFRSSLVRYAKAILTGQRTKTAKFVWGRVSLRSSKGSTQIINDEAALAFVKLWAPGEVKIVETVGVTAIQKALAAAQAACPGEEIPLPFVVQSGETENVDIETGVEATVSKPKGKGGKKR